MNYVLITEQKKVYFYVYECAEVFKLCLGGEIKELGSETICTKEHSDYN